jgi:uncharacterized membrane protein
MSQWQSYLKSVASKALALGVTIVSASNAQAGCWPVWQGIYSRMECDSAGVVPTFGDLRETIHKWSHLTPECRRAVSTTFQRNRDCAAAMAAAIESGGVMMVGAGYSCKQFYDSIDEGQRHCKEYLSVRTVRDDVHLIVCNNRSETASFSWAKRVTDSGLKRAYGWWKIHPGDCIHLTDHLENARVIYGIAKIDNTIISPRWNTDDLDDKATFCTKSTAFSALLPEPCHDNEENTKFRNFGRIPYERTEGKHVYYKWTF